MTTISSIRSLTLDFPPSCIAFCPSHPEYFVVGTYFLHSKEDEQLPGGSNTPVNEHDQAEQCGAEPAVNDESTQKRTGSLVLFRLDGETM